MEIHTFDAPVIKAAGLVVGMLVCLELGRRVGARRVIEDPDGWGIGAVDSAIFALFGLLLAFTFSSAAQRFDTRREQIVQEANNIGTAWLRVELLPAEAQPGMRDLFRKYVDSRIETYRKIPDMVAVQAEMDRSAKLQQEIWTKSVVACNAKKDPATTTLLLSALNDMFDITTTRTMATKMHPPGIIFTLLFALALACAFLAGHGMSKSKVRSWSHIAGFAIIMTACIYVILDLEHPRAGFIQLTEFDKLIVQVRESMN